MTALSVVTTPPPNRETALWSDVKDALDKIDGHADDILKQWVVIGERLTELKDENTKRHGGSFSAAAKRHGIHLSGQQMSAAQWWAWLPQTWRDKLHAEFPDALAPKWLQDRCRENYPHKARIGKSSKFPSRENGGIGKNTPKKASPKEVERDHGSLGAAREVVRPLVEAGVPISRTLLAKEIGVGESTIERACLWEQGRLEGLKEAGEDKRLEIAAEEHRKEIQVKQQARAAARTKDIRPRLKEDNTPIVMYGFQMWPVTEQNHIGYDYDQLFFAIHQFKAWRELVVIKDPESFDHASLAIKLRGRIKHLHLFVTRRLEGPCQAEMKAFIAVMQKLADLYEADPTGECRHPSDKVVR